VIVAVVANYSCPRRLRFYLWFWLQFQSAQGRSKSRRRRRTVHGPTGRGCARHCPGARPRHGGSSRWPKFESCGAVCRPVARAHPRRKRGRPKLSSCCCCCCCSIFLVAAAAVALARAGNTSTRAANQTAVARRFPTVGLACSCVPPGLASRTSGRVPKRCRPCAGRFQCWTVPVWPVGLVQSSGGTAGGVV